jgi:hypothetical protein
LNRFIQFCTPIDPESGSNSQRPTIDLSQYI